jgi:hypothetical protein
VDNGQKTLVDLDLEFEGSRAYIIWDSVRLGDYQLKARLEIDPSLLKRVERGTCDFYYEGHLVLPRPQDN